MSPRHWTVAEAVLDAMDEAELVADDSTPLEAAFIEALAARGYDLTRRPPVEAQA